jgi:Nop53 (60S ribosomal biogenesis)
LCSGIVREKPDAELFSIDPVGAPSDEIEAQTATEPTKKRRKPLHVDQVLGITDSNQPIQSYIPKNKRPKVAPPEKPPKEETASFDVWTKEDIIPAPKDLPPPATLPYSKSRPPKAPPTIRSKERALRSQQKAQNVVVAAAGQSYNPTLEDWEQLIETTAEGEQQRLHKIAKKERVATPEEGQTPEDSAEEDEEEENQVDNGESFLGKPVRTVRKTRAQRNRQAREQGRVFPRPSARLTHARNVYEN